MKPIDPQIVDVDINSPMSQVELMKLNNLQQMVKDKWIDDSKFNFEQGKRLCEIRDKGWWKYEEIFRVKTGKNRGKFDKRPSFDKYLKNFVDTHNLGTDVSEMKKQIKFYEGHLKNKKFYEEQLKKLKRMEGEDDK